MFFAPTLRTARFAPRAYDRAFERFASEAFAGARRSPLVEQDDKSWTLSLDVPGFSREDLAISIEGAVLRIDSKAEAKRQYKAAYELAEEIDAEATTARLENGVLTLTLAKKVPVSNARSIEIK